jgi:hypothetical protein
MRLSQIKLFGGRAYAVAINATSQQNGSGITEYYDPLVRTQMANTGPAFRLATEGLRIGKGEGGRRGGEGGGVRGR